MTTNAFLFSWDENGVEAIVPITQYEDVVERGLAAIAGKKMPRNPLDQIITSVIMRARANGQRHYEVYTIDCTEDFTEEVWADLWANQPQYCADIVREKGVKLYCNRRTGKGVRIV